MKGTAVALIPARGGSQGIPKKNLSEVGGFTLLARAIRSAKDCPQISSVFVSSDDNEIREIAKNLGARAVVRPDQLSSGSSRAEEVVEHFLATPEGSVLRESDTIVYLQPTSPFRSEVHVIAALEALNSHKSQCLVSVKEITDYPSKALTIGELGLTTTTPFWKDSGANRQDLPVFHYPNGAIYAFTIEAFRSKNEIPTIGALAFLMGSVESLDIDTPDDLLIAQAVANHAQI